jgi:cytoskeletal protein RodZ
MAVDVGTELAHARKTRALSLQELSRRTRISVTLLSAIERGDVARLPGGIFTRSFVRAYAREVGCDPETTVARFLAEYADPVAPADHEPHTPMLTCDTGQVHVADIDRREKQLSRAAWARFAMVITVLVLGYAGYKATRSQRDVGPSAAMSHRPPPEVSAATSREVGTAGVPEAPRDVDRQPASQADALQLDIEATARCWVTATVDGRRVVYRLLASGERIGIEVRDAVVLRVGDAGGFRFAVNGQAGRPLGAAGQTVTVTMTPKNYQDFVVTR